MPYFANSGSRGCAAFPVGVLRASLLFSALACAALPFFTFCWAFTAPAAMTTAATIMRKRVRMDDPAAHHVQGLKPNEKPRERVCWEKCIVVAAKSAVNGGPTRESPVNGAVASAGCPLRMRIQAVQNPVA